MLTQHTYVAHYQLIDIRVVDIIFHRYRLKFGHVMHLIELESVQFAVRTL